MAFIIGCICDGAYTRLKLDHSQDGHAMDSSAFVYSIRSSQGYQPQIYPIQYHCQEAVQLSPYFYLSFGSSGSAFWIHKNGTCVVNESECVRYQIPSKQLNGEFCMIMPKEIEVFQLRQVVS